MYIIGQIIGVVAFALCVVGFIQRKDHNMKLYLASSSFLASISYYLIGAYSGAAIFLINAVRNFLATKFLNNTSLLVFFLIFYLAVGAYSYQDLKDIFPILGAICSTISVFFLKDIKFRIGMLIACIFWLIYNIITISIGPIMMEIFNIIASLYSIKRLTKDKS